MRSAAGSEGLTEAVSTRLLGTCAGFGSGSAAGIGTGAVEIGSGRVEIGTCAVGGVHELVSAAERLLRRFHTVVVPYRS